MHGTDIFLVYEQDENGEFLIENLLGVFDEINNIEKKILKESVLHYKSIGVSEGQVYYMVVKTTINNFADFNSSEPIFYEIDIKKKIYDITTKKFFTFFGTIDDAKK